VIPAHAVPNYFNVILDIQVAENECSTNSSSLKRTITIVKIVVVTYSSDLRQT